MKNTVGIENLFFNYWAKDISRTDDSITFSVIFDPETMVFMKDHRFGGKYLVPGTVIMDLMATACGMFQNKRDIFPLRIEQIDILRAIMAEDGESERVTLTAKRVDTAGKTTTFEVSLKGDKKNAAGKVVRKNVAIARAVIKTNISDGVVQRAHPAGKKKIFSNYPQEQLYKEYIKSHGPLFVTLEGEIYANEDINHIVTFFSTRDKEDGFSVQEGLQFLLSPLGVDSMMQTAVYYSISHPAVDDPFYYTKLPVGIRNFTVLTPFEQNTRYLCRGNVISNGEKDLVLSLSVEDGNTFAAIEQAHMKEAPFVQVSRELNLERRRDHKNCTREVVL